MTLKFDTEQHEVSQLAWAFYFTNICCNITVAIIAIVACIFASYIKDDEAKVDLFSVLFQINEDWAVQPFVKIDSFDGPCPAGWDPVFERQWLGVEEGCLVSYQWLKKGKVGVVTQSDTVVSTEEMENFERGEIIECKEKIEAIDAVNQTSFGGRTICGQRGGEPFSSVTRVDTETTWCPEGTSACASISP